MRFKPDTRPDYRLEWHDWFAWYPVLVIDTWVWLETIKRVGHLSNEYKVSIYKEEYTYWEWSYKFKEE